MEQGVSATLHVRERGMMGMTSVDSTYAVAINISAAKVGRSGVGIYRELGIVFLAITIAIASTNTVHFAACGACGTHVTRFVHNATLTVCTIATGTAAIALAASARTATRFAPNTSEPYAQVTRQR